MTNWYDILTGLNEENSRNLVGATHDEINSCEKRLKIILPKSYRAFLKTSNGFKNPKPLLEELLSVDKITWLKDSDDFFIKTADVLGVQISDDEYFNYSDAQTSETFRSEYLTHCIKISEWTDGRIILLNSVVKYGDEWEVIDYAAWYPGAIGIGLFRIL